MTHGTHNALPDPRNENIQIFINGEFFARNDAKISVFDSGYLVGDGVWEGIRLHNGKLAFIDDHLKRLWEAAKTVGTELPILGLQLKTLTWKVIPAALEIIGLF